MNKEGFFYQLPPQVRATIMDNVKSLGGQLASISQRFFEWHELKNSLPSSVELVGEYTRAWGSEYNGFLLFEAARRRR